MKIFAKTVLLALIAVACHPTKKAMPTASKPAETAVKPAPKPADWVKWEKPFVELGKVKKGEKRSFFYDFTNTTSADVQVEIIDACDCTTVEFPRTAKKPGEGGRFDVTFNSTEKDSSETIEIRVIWKQRDAAGNPRFDVLKYHYDLVK